jgi:hypothetical protein
MLPARRDPPTTPPACPTKRITPPPIRTNVHAGLLIFAKCEYHTNRYGIWSNPRNDPPDTVQTCIFSSADFENLHFAHTGPPRHPPKHQDFRHILNKGRAPARPCRAIRPAGTLRDRPISDCQPGTMPRPHASLLESSPVSRIASASASTLVPWNGNRIVSSPGETRSIWQTHPGRRRLSSTVRYLAMVLIPSPEDSGIIPLCPHRSEWAYRTRRRSTLPPIAREKGASLFSSTSNNHAKLP